jgi:ABC-type nitrate/sulfonate/bicarbonate transport system ATPase subunit
MTDKFISIEGIARRYPGADGGQISVFENLWLSMSRGEFGCVIGHSGCGKTTVLNILAGLDEPSEGAVIVAAEMLVGGTGIGYFVWNEWNNLSITNVITAILLIGLVGMVLDQLLARVAKLVTFPE